MSWVYLDDAWPEHPKFDALGTGVDADCAAAMWVVGLCWVNRNTKNGFIPDARVPKLSRHPKPAKLAELLVRVALWDKAEGGFAIHNYEPRNATAVAKQRKEEEAAQARSAKARNAARARHDRAQVDAQAMLEQTPEHDPSRDQAGVEQAKNGDRAAPRTRAALAGAGMPLSPNPLDTSSSTHQSVAPTGSDEEELKISEACRLVAERRFKARPAGEVRNPTQWKATVAADVRKDTSWAPMLRANLTAEAMCEAVEPTPAVPSCEVPFVPTPPLTDEEREASRRAREQAKAERETKVR
jgi:hypothetical protein